MNQVRYFIVIICLMFLSPFFVSCAPSVGRAYTGPVLPRDNVAYIVTSVYGNYVESIDGISASTIEANNGVSCGIFEVSVGTHTIRASFWQQTRGTGGWVKTTAGGGDGIPLKFAAVSRHIYRVANKPSCPEGEWCPFVKDITGKIDVPSNYEYIYHKAKEQ